MAALRDIKKIYSTFYDYEAAAKNALCVSTYFNANELSCVMELADVIQKNMIIVKQYHA